MHMHNTLAVEEDFQDPDGRPVNHLLLGQLTSAAYEGCKDCQGTYLEQVMTDAPTSARVVEIACMALEDTLGGVPTHMKNLGSPEFRRLADAGVDGRNEQMWALCGEMTPDERRSAVDAALTLLVGILSVNI